MTPELIAIITLSLGLAGLILRQGQRLDRRIDRLEEQMNERFKQMDERFAKVDERFRKLEERMAAMEIQQAKAGGVAGEVCGKPLLVPVRLENEQPRMLLYKRNITMTYYTKKSKKVL